MGTRRRINHWVKSCAIKLSGMHTTTHLNVLPLGGYEILLGMDWLYSHWTKVDFYEKVMECLDEKGMKRIFEGEKNSISVRWSTTMQSKCNNKKIFMCFAVHVSKNEEADRETKDKGNELLQIYIVLQ